MYRLGIGDATMGPPAINPDGTLVASTDGTAAATAALLAAQPPLDQSQQDALLAQTQAANPVAAMLGITTSTANWLMVGGGVLILGLMLFSGGRRR